MPGTLADERIEEIDCVGASVYQEFGKSVGLVYKYIIDRPGMLEQR